MARKKTQDDTGFAGKTVKEVRLMTREELVKEGWDEHVDRTHTEPMCMVFDDGTVLYPSRDYEGNGPGVFFATKDGKHFAIT
jgi:hypothetical protein